MKKVFLSFICAATLGSVACNKMIDLSPISSISEKSFWKTADDAKGAVGGLYSILRSESKRNLFIFGELRSDAVSNSAGAAIYMNWYAGTLTTSNSGKTWHGEPVNWAALYSIIHNCNLAIKYIPDINFNVQAEKDNLLAQAYAMRAYAYFVITRTYGKAPIYTAPASDDLNNLQRPASSEQDIFTLIKEDIEKAITLFPNNNLAARRNMWSMPAVQALKGEVYLWTAKRMNGGTADYTTALTALNAVQNGEISLLNDFGRVFDYDNKANNEIIFSISRSYEEDPEVSIHAYFYTSEVFFPTTMDQATKDKLIPTGGAAFMSPSPEARNVFNQHDVRKDRTIVDIKEVVNGDTVVNHSVLWKFGGTVVGGTRYWIDDYIIFRYADVLLMIAEAKNGLGQDPATEINLIRQRAYGAQYSNYVFSNGSPASNDEAILEERFRELMFEGKRWWDLLRFGKAFEKVPGLQGRESETHQLLFPIPIETLSINGQLTPTPGYN
jgi:hypothetical protein